ncbi:MAG: hypothetical protein R3F39_21475 [Myxococcota bacterium]
MNEPATPAPPAAAPAPAEKPVFPIAGSVPVPSTVDRFVRAQPETFSAGSQRAFRALARAVCPVEVGPDFPDVIGRIEGYVLGQLPYMNPVIRWALGPLCRLVDWSPVWRFRGLRPIRSLSREKATAELNGMVHSPFSLVRNAFYPVKALILAGYYDQPEVHTAMNYEPLPFIRERVAFRARLMAGEAARPEDLLMGLPGPAGAPPNAATATEATTQAHGEAR